MNNSSILNTRKLKLGYKGKSLCTPLNLHLYEGQLVCLIGQNGCGKSTLLRSIGGLQAALGGDVNINDYKLKNLNNKDRAKLVSYVLTDRNATDSLTVRQVVEMGRLPYTNMFGTLAPADKEVCESCMQKVGITRLADRTLSEISDGERQRTFIAKAIAQDTPIILLDEPDAYLDLPNKIGIMHLLKSLARDNSKAILLSTHELELALQVADQIWLMSSNGIERGTPEDLVLEEKIQMGFNSENCRFDTFNGIFKINGRQTKPIGFKNEGTDEIAAAWTKRALERKGYYISDSEELLSITLTEKREWQLSSPDSGKAKYHNIEDLLSALR